MTVQRTSELADAGLSGSAVVRSARAGQRIRVRHGAWTDTAPSDDLERHRQLIAGTWPLVGAGAVLSHASAAVLHGLPTWPQLLGRVSITRACGGHGTRTPNLHVRLTALVAEELAELGGYRLTTLERTAMDVARSLDLDLAVAVLDAALRLGADREVLNGIAGRSAHQLGIGVARRALAFADGRSESVGESISRVRIAQCRLPTPVLQFEVFHNGRWVARTDFAWPELRVIGEFDGRIKYLGSPEEVADVIIREKRRQQAIEGAGWRVVRWTWADLSDRTALAQRLGSVLTARS